MEPKVLRKQHYLDSLYHFAKFGLKYNQMTPQTHGPIAKALQADTLRKLLCVPRGTFKSSIAAVSYPIWLLEHNPNLRIMIDSELHTNSTNFLREIKGHYEMNEDFRDLFGDRVGKKVWNDSEIIISTRTKNLKEPSIVCSGIGAGKTSQHYDVIIADDLSSYKNCRTKDLAQKTLDHYKLYTSLLEPNGIVVIIGTRYSEMDIIRFVIENELGIKDGDVNLLKKIYG